MLIKSNSYDPTRYPIVLQVINDQVVASQPDLNIYRSRGKFSELKKLEEIGAVVMDVIEEAAKRIKAGDIPKPSIGSEALINSKRKPRNKFMTSPGAAALSGLSLQTIYRMCNRNELQFKFTPGGHRRIYVNEHNLKALNIENLE